MIVIPLFLHALFLERVQLHHVIVVPLNILAAVKHKVFCTVSGFGIGQKTESTEQRWGSVCSGLCCYTHTWTKDVLLLSLRTLRMIHVVNRGVKVLICYFDAFSLHGWQVAYLYLTAADRGRTAFLKPHNERGPNIESLKFCCTPLLLRKSFHPEMRFQ